MVKKAPQTEKSVFPKGIRCMDIERLKRNAEYATWAYENVRDLLNKFNEAVCSAFFIDRNKLTMRFAFDSDYDRQWTEAQNECEFGFHPGERHQEKQLGVAIVGIMVGNMAGKIEKVEIIIGGKKVREIPKAVLPTKENDIYLMPDGVFTLEKKYLSMDFTVTPSKNPTKRTLRPLAVVAVKEVE